MGTKFKKALLLISGRFQHQNLWGNCFPTLLPLTQVPYDDLRYLFGEIMYGGHITDDWDRRLCRTYLEEFIRPEMLEGELSLAPGFPLPGNMDYSGYHQVRHSWTHCSVTICPAQFSMHMLTLEQDWGPGKDSQKSWGDFNLVLCPELALLNPRGSGFPASN